MDIQNNNNPYINSGYPPSPSRPSGDKLATAAMVLGILSIVTAMTFTIYPSLILGSIGIILALLSKGRSPKLISKARIGTTCALFGILLTVSVLFTTIKAVYNNPELLKQSMDIIEKQYGISYEEMLNIILNGGELPVQ